MTQQKYEKKPKEKIEIFKDTLGNQAHIKPELARIGYVFNPKTQLFDIKTVITGKNSQGQWWCEDVPTKEFNEKGKLVEVYGKWVDSDLIKFE